jgi:hypothetical protein
VIRSVSRLRALVVAFAALVLTAGVALAGHSALSMPSASSNGLERAADAAGKIVPVAGPAENADEQTDEDADEDVDTDEPAAGKPADDQPADAASHPDNHGAVVSVAAQDPTPAGFDNHGQYVKTIATDNAGQAEAAKHAPTKAPKAKPAH